MQRHADETRFFHSHPAKKNLKLKSNQATDCLHHAKLHLICNINVKIHLRTTTLNKNNIKSFSGSGCVYLHLEDHLFIHDSCGQMCLGRMSISSQDGTFLQWWIGEIQNSSHDAEGVHQPREDPGFQWFMTPAGATEISDLWNAFQRAAFYSSSLLSPNLPLPL